MTGKNPWEIHLVASSSLICVGDKYADMINLKPQRLVCGARVVGAIWELFGLKIHRYNSPRDNGETMLGDPVLVGISVGSWHPR